jgi:hypothetical protein
MFERTSFGLDVHARTVVVSPALWMRRPVK